MAWNPVTALRMGWWAENVGSSSLTRSLDTNNRCAQGFQSPVTSTITSVRVYATATSGSPTTADFKAALYSNDYTNWRPNTLIEEVNCASSPATGYNNFTGWTGTAAVTQGLYYWIVFRNNGAAAFVTVRQPDRTVYPSWASSTLQSYSPSYKETTDGGTNWGNDDRGSTCFIRIGFADGSYFGFPITSVWRFDENVLLVQGTTERGIKFTTPPVSIKARGVELRCSKVGTPAGDARARLYKGTALIATTNTVPAANIPQNGGTYPFWFASTQTLDASSVYRVVLGATGADAGANGYYIDGFEVDSDSNSVAIYPWNGTSSVTNLVGGSWTDTATRLISHNLILDDPAFGAASGGSGLMTNQQMTSMG